MPCLNERQSIPGAIMKINSGITLALVLAASLVCPHLSADTITEKNVEKARAVIEAAVAAHGGEAGLDSIETMIVKHDSIGYAVDQSRGTEAPWDETKQPGLDAIEFGSDVFYTYNEFDGSGFQGVNATIIDGKDSYQIDHRAGTLQRISEPDYDTTSGPFIRVTATALVRTLGDRAGNAHYLGEATVDDVTYDVVGFSMAVGPAISLYFDQEDHLLRRSERVLPNFGLVQYEWSDYEEIDGFTVAKTFRFYFNGDLNIHRKLVDVRFNEPLDELLAVNDDLLEIDELTPDELSRQEIADDVWLIGGNGTYAMFVDMGDYIFAAGGIAGIPERIESLREVVGEKPIRYGMLTHHHFDHVVGVQPYESIDATIIAAKAHEKIARRAAADDDALKLKTVEDRMTLTGDNRTVEIIDIGPTAHSEHLLVAYLPDEGILFEADHFALPRVGPIPPAVESTRSFAAALRRLELDVEYILSAHSPKAATMDDLQTAISTMVSQATQ